MKLTIAGVTFNPLNVPTLVAVLQECRDYLDLFPETAAGGDDEARRLVALIDRAMFGIETQPPGSQPPGATSRPDTRRPTEPGNRIIPGFEG